MAQQNSVIGLRDVAAAGGVSVGTASQALRGTGTTSQKTRERIRKLAADMGYQPDPLMAAAGARRRAGQKGPANIPVGFLVGSPASYRDRFASVRFQEECCGKLEEDGYSVSIAAVETRDHLRRTLREWYHQGLRGLMLSHFWHPKWLLECDWSAFSAVYLGGRIDRPVFHTIRFSAAHGLDCLLEGALQCDGKVGVVLAWHSEQRVMDDSIREGVFAYWKNAFPERFTESLHLPFEGHYPQMLEQLSAWLKQEQPASVVGPLIISSMLEQINSAVRIFTLSDEPNPASYAGAIETPALLARTAVKTLEDMIRRRETGIPEFPLLISVPPRWVDPPQNPNQSQA